MSYSKINWQDLPSTSTPVNATNLNKMDNAIADANNSIGVDAYDSTSTYNIGDFCIYNNTLYRCKTKITTAEAFNSSKWDANTIEEYIQDTGWITATLNTNFKAYNGLAGNTPRYRKVGKLVEINGMVSPKANITAGTSGIIFNIPSGYRPYGFTKYAICQGSGQNRWLLTVTTGGDVKCERYGVATAVDFPADCWMPFTISYFID